ncbi:MAG TPA: heavy metal translocating P-type ATPase, partial [Bacteroidetes bacterium]|nr:heavy metal translocating P-type ATPase [Bacteroidota bacterium]
IVFDKTGTLTETSTSSVHFVGPALSPEETQAIASIAHGSTHPLSRLIYQHLGARSLLKVTDFLETEGGGIRGTVRGLAVALGSRSFVYGPIGASEEVADKTRVYVSVGDRRCGWFEFHNRYRDGAQETLAELGNHYALSVLSGDTPHEANRLESLYPGFAEMRFEQKPADKLEYIRHLQQNGKKVLMVGDGLNDAGALWQSDVAIAVTEQNNAFSPACDAILNGSSFARLASFMSFTTSTIRVVYWSFALSLLYNFIGLYFAVQGALSPIFAAILMPLSSISVVVFSTLLTRGSARSRRIV